MPTAELPTQRSSTFSRLRIGHQGKGMMIVADTYSSLFHVFMEVVQNAIDAHALNIWIYLDQKRRRGIVQNDGKGVSQNDFDNALQSVLVTSKDKKTQLGQFGRGLVSPIGKCKAFSFSSRSNTEEDQKFLRWEFNTARIEASEDEIQIPVYVRTDVTPEEFPKRGVRSVPWNTEVDIKEYTADPRISRISLDLLASGILDRFRIPMHDREIKVMISFVDTKGKEEKRTIKAAPFEGDPLPEFITGSPEDGEVFFRLFRAPKKGGGRFGSVSVGVKDELYRFPFRTLAENCFEIVPKVSEALTSGFFTGEILSTKCRLDASRKHFVDDVYQLNFAIALEDWFEQVGEDYLQRVKEETEDQRFKTLGLEALNNLRDLLTGDDCPPTLRDVIGKFEIGNVGKNHCRVPKTKIIPETDFLATSLDGAPGAPRTPGDGEPREFTQPNTEHEEHVPLVVKSKGGRVRQLVKDNSLGLTLSHEEMPGVDKLWEFDAVRGVLAFNIRHPLWEACEGKNMWLVKLQEFVVLQALTLHSVARESDMDTFRVILDELLVPWVSLMVRPSPKKK